MKQIFNEKRTAVLSCIVILLSIFADFYSRTAVKTVMASRTHIPVLCVETDRKELALTFSITPDSDVNEILSELGEIKATFFVDENTLGTEPEAVNRIAGNGHEIGLLRGDLKGNTQHEIYDKMAEAVEEAARITGFNSSLVRFDRNYYDSNAVKAIFSLGLTPVQWSADSTASRYSAGDIVLVTDGTDIRSLTEKIKADGFRIVTVGEMLIKGNYKIDICGRMMTE